MRTISKTALVTVGLVSLVGTASAGDPKAGKPAPKDAPAAIKPKEPPPPPPVPEPTPELKAQGKKMKGTWKCVAEMYLPDGTTYQNKFTIKIALDLDNMWLKTTMTEAKKKGVKKPFKFTAHQTYDAATKTWHQLMVSNMGTWAKSTSAGPDASGKVTWEGTSSMGGQDFKSRDFEEWTDKKSWHMWGEWSPDGASWVKSYDAACKR
jgi:hypothetical protein